MKRFFTIFCLVGSVIAIGCNIFTKQYWLLPINIFVVYMLTKVLYDK